MQMQGPYSPRRGWSKAQCVSPVYQYPRTQIPAKLPPSCDFAVTSAAKNSFSLQEPPRPGQVQAQLRLRVATTSRPLRLPSAPAAELLKPATPEPANCSVWLQS